MTKYILKRLLHVIPVLLFVSVIVFSMMHLIPGDPIRIMLGSRATPETVAALHSEYNLDKPLVVQYLLWLKDVVSGDLGYSIRQKAPVTELILQRLPATLSIGITSLCLASIISIVLGVLAAFKRNSSLDFTVMLFAVFGISTPTFWLCLLGMIIFALYLGILPSIGYVPFSQNPVEYVRHLILPVSIVTLKFTGYLTKMTRSQMVEVLGQDYVITARAKGLREVIVVGKHALKNAMIPIVTVIGLEFGFLLTSALFVEVIFGIPGVGRLVVDAITYRDYPIVQGVVLFSSLAFVFLNLIVDILYRFLDPKVRYK